MNCSKDKAIIENSGTFNLKFQHEKCITCLLQTDTAKSKLRAETTKFRPHKRERYSILKFIRDPTWNPAKIKATVPPSNGSDENLTLKVGRDKHRN